MDTLTSSEREKGIGALSTKPHQTLPVEAPFEMPVQSLTTPWTRQASPETTAASSSLRRALVIGATAIATGTAAYEMYKVLQVGGLTIPEYFILGLFILLFAWISFSLVSAIIGFFDLLFKARAPLGIEPEGALPKVSSRTALLVPTYNEEPHRVMAHVQAIQESLTNIEMARHFEFFILSDTTDPDIWVLEEASYLALLKRTGSQRIFYRHRHHNIGGKAGNIGEWVTRFGGHYNQMIILDADSLMTGDTLVRLVSAMECHPKVGLIQTIPLIINGKTLFARMQQFAGRMYGPIIARGNAWWHGSESNYWGHNAIIRVRAFAEQAGLPELPGRKPFGGHIISHDFVEAALMRRAGWAIHIVPHLPGSYEEMPPSLTDYAARDRRWCQGNLQHMLVLPARGLHWVSRLHLLAGIGSYITAPLWLAFLVTGIGISLQAQFVRPEFFPAGFSLFPKWPAQDPVLAAWVFAVSMGILIFPKLLAYLLMLSEAPIRRSFGGAANAFIGVILETIISALIAPAMMLIQSQAIAAIMMGRDVGWQVQRRNDGSLSWPESARRYAGHTVFGFILGASAYAVSLPLFLWMTPVVVGLLLTIPLAVLTSYSRLGDGFKRVGLFVTPEEHELPEIVRRSNEVASELARDQPAALHLLLRDRDLAEIHRQMIAQKPAKKRGEVDVDLVVGRAKLEQTHNLEEANSFLTIKEKAAILADPVSFEQLIERLKDPVVARGTPTR